MTTDSPRRWYTEPETFIAVAALVVSLSAVVVGIYEASLQRHHDRAEVWPHLEIGLYTKPTAAIVTLENTGIGPGIVQSVIVTVDGHPQNTWRDALRTLDQREPGGFNNLSALQHGMRPGERLDMLEVPATELPANFEAARVRIGVSVCYASVFDQYWIVETKQLGGTSTWRAVNHCPAQTDSVDF